MLSDGAFRPFYFLVLGLRRSFDLPLNRSRLPVADFDKIKEVALCFESLRIDLQAARGAENDLRFQCLKNVREKLFLLKDDPEFLEIAQRLRLRPIMQDRENGFEELREEGVSVVDGINIFLARFAEIEKQPSTDGSAALRRVVPNQKLAPAMFDIVAGKLVLVKQVTSPLPEDRKNIQQARDALLDRGKNILEALERSNCDRRVLQSIRDLQDALGKEDNIIELGLRSLGVDRICKNAAGELPEALSGTIEGHIAGIGMYVAQHLEWQRFSENAASVELDTDDVEKIAEAAQAIINGLERNPEISDQEVPQTLKALNTLLQDPRLAKRRAAFAVLRTVENLVAKVYQYGADYIDKTATKTIDGLSGATSKVIVGAMIAVAISATTSLGGLASGKIPESAWMRSAAEIVIKQLEKLAKD